MIEQHDDHTIRCPKLGHDVNFKYCRIMNDRLPCRWIAGCWQGRIDVHPFLTDHYSEEELSRVCALPKSKMETLMELVEKAKKSREEAS